MDSLVNIQYQVNNPQYLESFLEWLCAEFHRRHTEHYLQDLRLQSTMTIIMYVIWIWVGHPGPDSLIFLSDSSQLFGSTHCKYISKKGTTLITFNHSRITAGSQAEIMWCL